MLRTLSVSTEVFAAIWKSRKEGEETEDAILRRLLKCSQTPATKISFGIRAASSVGVHDTRNNVLFPEGFEIFRTYKGNEYKAVAHAGLWVRPDTGQSFPSLNSVNRSITGDTAENVWNGNWKFRNEKGRIESIDALRHKQS